MSPPKMQYEIPLLSYSSPFGTRVFGRPLSEQEKLDREKRHRAHAVAYSPAWAMLAAENSLKPLSGTQSVPGRVMDFDTLYKTCGYLGRYLLPKKQGGFLPSRPPRTGGEPEPWSCPIILPNHISGITVRVGDRAGNYVDSSVRLFYHEPPYGGFKDVDVWAGRLQEILPLSERSQTHLMQGVPMVVVHLRRDVVEAFYDRFPQLRERTSSWVPVGLPLDMRNKLFPSSEGRDDVLDFSVDR